MTFAEVVSKRDGMDDSRLCTRYRKLLGIPAEPPALGSLENIVRAQALTVPFENVSKLYLKRHAGLQGLIGFADYLEGIERYHFGGTCYATNYYLHRLLLHLGYDVRLCGADMRNPDVHLVNIVKIGGGEFLVDAGNAAPFLRPLPRYARTDVVTQLGASRYVLRPQDEHGCSRVDMYLDGVLKHGYTAKPAPRHIDEFREVIARSFDDGATFMNALLLVRLEPDRSLVIRNMSLIISKGIRSQRRILSTRDELLAVITATFGMPRAIVTAALTGLEMKDDAWD